MFLPQVWLLSMICNGFTPTKLKDFFTNNGMYLPPKVFEKVKTPIVRSIMSSLGSVKNKHHEHHRLSRQSAFVPQCPHCVHLNRSLCRSAHIPTAHYMRETRDPSSRIICTVLKSTTCTKCLTLGHSAFFCKIVAGSAIAKIQRTIDYNNNSSSSSSGSSGGSGGGSSSSSNSSSSSSSSKKNNNAFIALSDDDDNANNRWSNTTSIAHRPLSIPVNNLTVENLKKLTMENTSSKKMYI